MTIRTNLLNMSKRLSFNFYRRFSESCVEKKELEVPTFCDVYINVPYSLKIKPLNVHKYHNCDKLIIEYDNKCDQSLEYNIDGNRVTITDKSEKKDSTCSIKVPVKANIFISSKKDINVGSINGDKISLESEDGTITLNKFHGKSVKITTKRGDIKLRDVIQASNIQATITETGTISTDRLQGLNLKLKTKEGDIEVKSSYCNESAFEVEKGNMNLSNLHKSCKIFLNDGHLNLSGFDGKLFTAVEKGSADIYLSRILENSNINIEQGSLHLKLAELCQEQVKFIVKAKKCAYSKDFKYVLNSKDCVRINPDIAGDQTVTVVCSNGSVMVDSASWHDMIQIKLKK